MSTAARNTPSTTAPVTAKGISAEANALIRHLCIIIYVDGVGFQMHPVEERLNATGPSVLINNKPFYRTMNPVFLAPPEHWSPDTIGLVPEIHENAFFGEVYFTQGEQGPAITASPCWAGLTETEHAAIKMLPVNTAS